MSIVNIVRPAATIVGRARRRGPLLDPGTGMNPADQKNPWALFDDSIDRVAGQCVTALTPKWSGKLAAFDVWIWDQCYAMEQSLRLE